MNQPFFHSADRATEYVPALTGLRALAAYGVFLHHYNPAPAGTFAHHFFQQGYIGVSVFFVLSGFLLYHRYGDPYLTRQHWSWRAYLQRRFARIMPVYLLLLAVTIAGMYATGHPLSWPDVFLNLTLLKGYFNDHKFSGLSQSWSLTVEWTFYLLAPWLFSALPRWGIIRLSAVLLSVGLLLWATIGQADWQGCFDTLPFLSFYTFFGRSFEFIIGMQLARRWQKGLLIRERHDVRCSVLLISCCVVWQAFITTVTDDAPTLFWSELITYNLLLPVGVTFLLKRLLLEPSLFQRLLASPIFQVLGRSSYAFYLIHIGVISWALLQTGLFGNTWLLFGALVGLSCGLYKWVEQPLHRWVAPDRKALKQSGNF